MNRECERERIHLLLFPYFLKDIFLIDFLSKKKVKEILSDLLIVFSTGGYNNTFPKFPEW